MPRPFTRQNDGPEAWEELTAPGVISSPQIIGDHGAVYDAASGAPITGYGYPHSFSLVGSSAAAAAAAAAAQKEKEDQANQGSSDQGSTGFQILDSTNVPSNTELPPAQPASPAAGAPGINIFSDSTCPKSNCLLWALGGIIVGKVLL